MKKAWIEDNRVRDICPGDPAKCYHPDIAQFYVTDIGDDVQIGATWDGHQWTNPAPPEPESAPPALIPIIGPIAFQMLFKVEELVAIDAAKETNAAIRIFWKLLDDPRTDFVDRNLEPVQTMLRNLEASGLLATGRAEEIIHGEVSK